MLFGHQNDAHQPQPQAAEQPEQAEPGFMGPQDQVAQTVAPQEPATPAATVPQDAGAGVNPLAVDPTTGVSLPAVPQGSSGSVDSPVDTPSPDADGQQSVLNQPSAPDANEPEEAPEVSTAADSAAAPAPQMESAPPYSGSPFSASTPVPDPAPVLDQAEEDHDAAAIAQELDTPGEEHSTVLSQEPAAPEAPAADTPTDPQPALSFDAPAADTTSVTPAAAPAQENNPLLDLKQQAIAQLSPLVSHLDQSPEEKFRTTMMLLQSTDNPALLHDAYTAAQAITDEKVRAQALLDVVNEINYFTQQQDAHAA